MIKNAETPKLGIALADAGVIRYPWYIAIYKGFVATFIGLINIFVGFYYLLKGLILGQGLVFDVAGPVGIANIVGQSAKLGFNYLLNITAMLSLSLAAINILPIPALDGGRIVFVVLEKILKKPVPMKYEQIAHTIGFVLLMTLIVVVTWRDVAKLF
ncbi:MAG: membrane-associated zinc metalloprotease [uncultured bacterium]|nr:MAG: membrane-associated zinc metalloprotease [uncultured bacterium]